MRKERFIFLIALFFCFYQCDNSSGTSKKTDGWKVGVATIVITPEQPLWMGGYASRVHPSEGKLHDLKAKALVFKDAKGKQSVLVTTDILGYPKAMSDNIRNGLSEKFGFSKAQIILSSTHTHSGPALEGILVDAYPMDNKQLDKVAQYSEKLEKKIIELVGQALGSMQAVKLFSGNGAADFQVNRLTNEEKTLTPQTKLNGPNDYTVPVLKVVDENEKILVVVFGYGCHPTVLNGYEWCGDYPGFAQLELEKLYPEASAMFFQASGADQNPIPRRTLPLAIKYGKELAASVENVLEGKMDEISPELDYSYAEITLSLVNQPSLEELSELEQNSEGYIKRWATRMISELKNGEEFQSSYAYPVQLWSLGNLPIVSLGGELVTEYSLEIRRILGEQSFVVGYSNDVMGYIPSSKILEEGGYEATSSQMAYGLAGVWSSNIEAKIIAEILRLAEEVKIPLYREYQD